MDENAPAKRTLHQASPIDAAPSIRAFLQFAAHGDDGPTDVPIHAIHRGPSGTIPLVQKEHGRDWQPLGALRIGQPFLPELCRVLVTDAYFALNTSYGKPKPRVTPRTVETWTPIPEQPGAEQLATRTKLRAEFTHPDTGLPLVEHSTDTLRWLNCCYADIDCYKVGLTVGDTLGAIVDLQDAGIIPPATLFARSGRGLWARSR